MPTEVTRLQIEVTPERMKELETFQTLGGLSTKKELWNNAFTLLKWAAKERANGAAICSLTDDGKIKELELPFLEAYATNYRRNIAERKDIAKPATANNAAMAKKARS